MKKTNRSRLVILSLICVFFFNCGTEDAGWNQVAEILNRIVPPQFPHQEFPVTEFGAIGDGRTDCTEAIRQAIAACHDSGGGSVVVPSGTFITGAIHLKSHVNLQLSEKAILKFKTDPDAYLPVVFTRFEGVECMNYSPFIYAFEQEDIAITGTGTLDGQADQSLWWTWTGSAADGWLPGQPHQKSDRDRLFEMAEQDIPVTDRIFGKGHYIRPNFIQPYRCKNVLIEGVTIIRSPMWEIHPVLCTNVTVRDIRVVSHGPNNDGCNPESCRDVLIKNCFFDTGDDCIAIKSGRNRDGRRIRVASENIVIQGCTMKDGHGGVVIGSEISGDCRNVFAENCDMDSPNLERAVRIKTNSLRGGLVENIYVRNIRIGQVSKAVIWINLHYAEGDVGEYTPVVRNVFISRISSQKSPYALFLDGYERSPIRNIQLEHCRFLNVEKENMLKYIEDLKLKHVFINGDLQPGS